MQSLTVTPQKLETKEWARKRPSTEEDCPQLIQEPTRLYNPEGELLVVYLKPEENLGPIRAAVQEIQYSKHWRTEGLKTHSRTIGFLPRVTIRRDFCTANSLARENPRAHGVLCSGAALGSKYLKQYAPERYAKQLAQLEAKVLPDWRLSDSVYTSGIANWNNGLLYHHDAGNFPDAWSAMLGFKRDIDGGHLAMPELGVKFEISDGSLILFNGQSVLHGVTPIRKRSSKAYRYTVVYYALRDMSCCKTAAEELARIRTVKTEREQRRRSAQE